MLALFLYWEALPRLARALSAKPPLVDLPKTERPKKGRRKARRAAAVDDSTAKPPAALDASGLSEASPLHVLPAPRPLPGYVVLAIQALRGIVRYLFLAHVAFISTTMLLIACYAFIDPPVTVLSLSRKYIDGWMPARQVPVHLRDVSVRLRSMLVSVEDSRFWTHPGFDVEAFKRAAEVNRRAGRPLYGGSTISMQVARTLFLLPVKSYVRKYLELIVTLELELLLSKERILELYLSWAEWGKGIYGVQAASRTYYGKAAVNLTLDQSARLVAILSSPIRFGPATVERSALLRSRYDYLTKKYGN